MKAPAVAVLGAIWLLPASADARPLRVLSLDQCADQYALALAPDAELALSPRADDPDSHLRALAKGRRQVRPTLEAATTFQPDVVIRYWGGEPRLLAALERRGVKTASVEDVADFDGVRMNIRRVAEALDRREAGEALIGDMDAKLARGRSEIGGSALYLTAGGFTAGSGTLIDAVFKAAGLRNLAPGAGYQPFSVERVVLEPRRDGKTRVDAKGKNLWEISTTGSHDVPSTALRAYHRAADATWPAHLYPTFQH